jgi:hypothetical protein
MLWPFPPLSPFEAVLVDLRKSRPAIFQTGHYGSSLQPQPSPSNDVIKAPKSLLGFGGSHGESVIESAQGPNKRYVSLWRHSGHRLTARPDHV